MKVLIIQDDESFDDLVMAAPLIADAVRKVAASEGDIVDVSIVQTDTALVAYNDVAAGDKLKVASFHLGDGGVVTNPTVLGLLGALAALEQEVAK
jgi:hypothetical protein